MKKFMAFAAVGVLVFSAAGCNKGNAGGNGESSQASYSFDEAMDMSGEGAIFLPYSSKTLEFDDSITDCLENDNMAVFANAYDDREWFDSDLEYAKETYVDEFEAEVEEFQLGDFSVTSFKYNLISLTTDYYVDFNSTMGSYEGALVTLNVYNEDKADAEEVKAMIENIYIAE